MASPLVYPEVGSASESVGGSHATSGLAGFPARDFFAPAGTAAVAPENAVVTRLSGSDPASPPKDPHGPYALSAYLKGITSGTTYFITHLGTTTVKPGDTVYAGQQIGTVADYAQFGTPSHLHIGTSGGTVNADQLAQAGKIGFPGPAGLPDPLNWAKNHPYSGGEVVSGDATIRSVTGGAAESAAGQLKSVGDAAVGAGEAAVSAYHGVSGFLGWISNPHNVQRVGEVIGGGVLVFVGVVMLGRATGAPTSIGAVIGK